MSVKTERAKHLIRSLRKLYPDAHCELDYSSAHELLFAVILSAQCTDVRVNATTKTMFKRYKTLNDYAAADPSELEAIIRSCGFYRMKAKSIIETARAVLDLHGGEVPSTMTELLALRGVARKTANVVLGEIYAKPEGVVVDTHMKRLSYRFGLTDEEDPVKVESDLAGIVPRKDWVFWSHAVIWHGRRVCKAAAPQCGACLLRSDCPQRGVESE
ncbi:MAG: endonuclease III [Elusimicrobia bacterium CG11_big_fil_rev_8_21_14_0_20_64_6]|nr:MAG: endonuclease III [Elusimicrobia bacterium CG11_big_fil_rev_8_21_14_0_20_64_6]